VIYNVIKENSEVSVMILFKNANIVTPSGVLFGYFLAYEDSYITYIGKEEIAADEVIDAEGDYLLAGFIDLHCHGCLGLAFNGASYEDAKTIADYHLSHGTARRQLPTAFSELWRML
jgi:N-acetylglucosamine-6-phosphate deacetylase